MVDWTLRWQAMRTAGVFCTGAIVTLAPVSQVWAQGADDAPERETVGDAVSPLGIGSARQWEQGLGGGSADAWVSLVQMFAALAFVVALIFVLAYVMRRLQGLSGRAGAQTVPIELVGQRALGTRERLVVVEVDGQRVLLGVGAGRIEALHRWAVGDVSASGVVRESGAAVPSAARAAASKAASFGAELDAARGEAPRSTFQNDPVASAPKTGAADLEPLVNLAENHDLRQRQALRGSRSGATVGTRDVDGMSVKRLPPLQARPEDRTG